MVLEITVRWQQTSVSLFLHLNAGHWGPPLEPGLEGDPSSEVLVARAASMVPKEAKMTSPPREGQRGSRAGASGLGLC